MSNGFWRFLEFWIASRQRIGLLCNSICFLSKALGAFIGTILYLYIFHFRSKRQRQLILPQYQPIAAFSVIFMYAHCLLWWLSRLSTIEDTKWLNFAQSALDEVAYDGLTLLLLKGHLGRTTVWRTAVECLLVGALGGTFSLVQDRGTFGLSPMAYNIIYHLFFAFVYILILIPLPLSIAAPRRNTVRAYAMWMLTFRLAWSNMSIILTFGFSGPDATMTDYALLPYAIFSLFAVMVSELPFALSIFAIARADTVYWVLGGRILVRQQQAAHGIRHQKQQNVYDDYNDTFDPNLQSSMYRSQSLNNNNHIQRSSSQYINERINFDENNLGDMQMQEIAPQTSMDFLFSKSIKADTTVKRQDYHRKTKSGDLYEQLLEDEDEESPKPINLKSLIGNGSPDPRQGSLLHQSMALPSGFGEDIDISLMASVVQNSKVLAKKPAVPVSAHHHITHPLDDISGSGLINDSLFESSYLHSDSTESFNNQASLYDSSSNLGFQSYDHNITDFYDYTSDLPLSVSSSSLSSMGGAQNSSYQDNVTTTHIRPLQRCCHEIRAITIDIVDMIFMDEDLGDDVIDEDDENASILNRIELRILNDADDSIISTALQSMLEANVNNMIYYQHLVSLDHHNILGSGAFSKVYSGLLALTSQQIFRRKQMYAKVNATQVQHIPYILSLFFRLHYESTISHQYKRIATKYQQVVSQIEQLESAEAFSSSSSSLPQHSNSLNALHSELKELLSSAQSQWNKSSTTTTVSAVISQYIDNREYDSLCINDTLGLWNREFCMSNGLLSNGLLLDFDSPNYLFYLYRYLNPEACSQLAHDSKMESQSLAKTVQTMIKPKLAETFPDTSALEVTIQTPNGTKSVLQLDEYAKPTTHVSSQIDLAQSHDADSSLNDVDELTNECEIVSNCSTQLLNTLFRLEASHREYIAEASREAATSSTSFLDSNADFVPTQNNCDENVFRSKANSLLKRFLIHISSEYTLSSLGYVHYTMNNKVLPGLEQVAQNSFYINPSPLKSPCPTNLTILNPIHSSLPTSASPKSSKLGLSTGSNESFLFTNKMSGPFTSTLSASLSNINAASPELRSTMLSTTNWINQQHNPLLDIPFHYFNTFSNYLQSVHQLHSIFSQEQITPVVSMTQFNYATEPKNSKDSSGKKHQQNVANQFDSFFHAQLQPCSYPIQPLDRSTFKLLWKLTEPMKQESKPTRGKSRRHQGQSTELILLTPLDKSKTASVDAFSNSIYNLNSNTLKIAAKFFLRSLALEPETIHQFSHETRLHCSLQHPNVVWLLGLCVLPPALAILSEICSQGSLMDLIQKQLTRKHELSTTVLLLHKIKTQLETTINSTRHVLLHQSTESLTGGKEFVCRQKAAEAIQLESPQTSSTTLSQSPTALSTAPQQQNIPFSSYLLKIQDLYHQLYKAQGNMVNILSKVHSIRDRLCLARDCGSAIAYLHHKKILHRDIKSPNFLIDSKLRVKITDFGLSRELTQSPEEYYQNSIKGKPFNPYLAASKPDSSSSNSNNSNNNSDNSSSRGSISQLDFSASLQQYLDSLPKDDQGMFYLTTKTQLNILLSHLFPTLPPTNDDGLSILATIYDYSTLLETLGMDKSSQIEKTLEMPDTTSNIFNEKYIPFFQYSTINNNVLNTKPTSGQIFHAILQQQDYFSQLRNSTTPQPQPAFHSSSPSVRSTSTHQHVLSDATLAKNDKSLNNSCRLGVSNGASPDSNLIAAYGCGIVQFDYQLLPFVLHSIRVHQGFSTSPAYPQGFSFPFQDVKSPKSPTHSLKNNVGANHPSISSSSDSFVPTPPSSVPSVHSEEFTTQPSQIHHRQITTQKMGTTLTNLLENSLQTLDNGFNASPGSPRSSRPSSPRLPTSPARTIGLSSRHPSGGNLLNFDLGETSTQGEQTSSSTSSNDLSLRLGMVSVDSDQFLPQSQQSSCPPCDTSVQNFQRKQSALPLSHHPQQSIHNLPRSVHRYSGHQHISNLQNMLYDSLAAAANQFNNSLQLQTPSQTYSVDSFSSKSSIRSSREIANTQLTGHYVGSATGVSTTFPSVLCYGPNHVFTRPVSKDALLWTRSEDFGIFSPQYHPPVDFSVLFDDDMLLFPLKLSLPALDLFQRMAKRVDSGSKLNSALTGAPAAPEKKLNPRLKLKPQLKSKVTSQVPRPATPPPPSHPFKFEIDNGLMNHYITLKMTHYNQTITQSLRKYSVYSTLSRRTINKYHTNLKNSLIHNQAQGGRLGVSGSSPGLTAPLTGDSIAIAVDSDSDSQQSAPALPTPEDTLAKQMREFEEHLERKNRPKPIYNEDDFMTVGVGSKLWMAPEVFHIMSTSPNPDVDPFNHGPNLHAVYSYPSDIYSLGIVLYEIITQNPPPENKNDLNWSPFNPTTNNNSNTCSEIPLHIKMLITACLSPRPEDRPSADAIVNVLTLCIELLDNFYIHGNY